MHQSRTLLERHTTVILSITTGVVVTFQEHFLILFPIGKMAGAKMHVHRIKCT